MLGGGKKEGREGGGEGEGGGGERGGGGGGGRRGGGGEGREGREERGIGEEGGRGRRGGEKGVGGGRGKGVRGGGWGRPFGWGAVDKGGGRVRAGRVSVVALMARAAGRPRPPTPASRRFRFRTLKRCIMTNRQQHDWCGVPQTFGARGPAAPARQQRRGRRSNGGEPVCNRSFDTHAR